MLQLRFPLLVWFSGASRFYFLCAVKKNNDVSILASFACRLSPFQPRDQGLCLFEAAEFLPITSRSIRATIAVTATSTPPTALVAVSFPVFVPAAVSASAPAPTAGTAWSSAYTSASTPRSSSPPSLSVVLSMFPVPRRLAPLPFVLLAPSLPPVIRRR